MRCGAALDAGTFRLELWSEILGCNLVENEWSFPDSMFVVIGAASD